MASTARPTALNGPHMKTGAFAGSRLSTRFAPVLAGAVLAAGLFGAAAPAAADGISLAAFYRVQLSGVAIGKAGLNADVGGAAYHVKGWGKLSGMTAMFSNAIGAAASDGAVEAGSLTPARYDFDLKDDSEASRVAIGFAAGRVDKVTITPPEPERPDRVPLGDQHRLGAFDPMSALIVRHAPGADGATICNRTVPVFEGLQRFDLPLVYKKTVKVRSEDGAFKGLAHVCRARYQPLAGHRPQRWVIRYMMENKDLEVWLVPIGASGYSVPWRISIGTTPGPAVIEAEGFTYSGA